MAATQNVILQNIYLLKLNENQQKPIEEYTPYKRVYKSCIEKRALYQMDEESNLITNTQED